MTKQPVPSSSRSLSPAPTALLVAALSLAAGCIADGEPPPFEEPQADAQAELASIIKIQADTDLALVLFREGVSGAWHRATRITGSRYQALVRGPYTVLTVCETDDGPTTGIVSQTLQDPRLVEMDCVFEAEAPLPLVVSGTVVQRGDATLGKSKRTSFSPNWTFRLAAEARPTDFLVSGEGYAVRRTLPITGDLTVPPIDLVAQGTPLLPSQSAVTNPLPGEQIEGRTSLFNAAQEGMRLYRGPMPAKVAPPSLLLPGDRQTISVHASVDVITSTGMTTSYHDGGEAYQPGQPFALTLWRPLVAPPQLSFDALGDDQVTWKANDLDPQNLLGIDHYVFDIFGVFIYHAMSPSYVKQMRITSMTVPTHVPGFKDEWRVDRTDYTRNFVAFRRRPASGQTDGYGYADFVYPTFTSGAALGATSSEEELAAARARHVDARVEQLRAKRRVQ